MYKWVSQNRWPALLLVGMLGFTVYVLVGGGEGDGQIARTVKQLIAAQRETPAPGQPDVSDPAAVADIADSPEAAGDISPDGPSQEELSSFYGEWEDAATDTPTGFDPVPEFDGSPMLDPSNPDEDTGGWGVELPPD